jgi:hypothetical protein
MLLYDPWEIADMLDEYGNQPLFTRKEPAAAGSNGRDLHTPFGAEREGPVDVEAELDAMRYGADDGTSVNSVQPPVIASLLMRGMYPDDVIAKVVDATMLMAQKSNLAWSREAEVKTVTRRITSTLRFLQRKHDWAETGEMPPWLPPEHFDAWTQMVAAGKRPNFNRNNAGWHVRSYQERTARMGKGSAPSGSQETASEEPPKQPGSPDPHEEAPQQPQQPPQSAPQDVGPKASSWNFFDSAQPRVHSWLIKNLLPATGVAILSGQWGAFKTTIILEMAVAVMGLGLFADRYRIKRTGAVLYFAPEGAGTLKSRLTAIAHERGAPESLPFAWRSDCPLLTGRTVANEIMHLVNEAAAHFRTSHNVPVTMIVIDTYTAAAGLSGSDDDNSRAIAAKVYKALRSVADRSGALVVIIDHMGKVIEAGTTGSSGKEGAADTVLSALADRELNGAISNCRLAARKQRDGLSGFEIPFIPETLELGLDEDGDPMTAIILEWGKQQQGGTGHRRRKSKSTQLLCRLLVEVIAQKGFEYAPRPGETVRACHEQDLSQEFYERFPTGPDGTDKQKLDRRRKAYLRALKEATETGYVRIKNNGCTIVWPIPHP